MQVFTYAVIGSNQAKPSINLFVYGWAAVDDEAAARVNAVNQFTKMHPGADVGTISTTAAPELQYQPTQKEG